MPELESVSKGSELKSVRYEKCQHLEVPEFGSARIWECQNWIVPEMKSDIIGKCPVLSL